MRNDSLSAPTPAELLSIEEQREANRIERERLPLAKSTNRTAWIAAIAAAIAAIASIINIFITVLLIKK